MINLSLSDSFLKFYGTEDMRAQIKKTGVHSEDETVASQAILEQRIKGARLGSTQDLNFCWKKVKWGELTMEEYQKIKEDWKNN